LSDRTLFVYCVLLCIVIVYFVYCVLVPAVVIVYLCICVFVYLCIGAGRFSLSRKDSLPVDPYYIPAMQEL
jgi:hypothetical protein